MDNGERAYRRFLDGDDEGLVELIDQYREGLTLYLTGITGDVFLAEEAVEDVFFRLAVKKPRFGGKSAFKTWLYAIGRNLALDGLRRRKRGRERPLEEAAEEESLESACLREERKLTLHRAMKRLLPQYRQALYLKYFEGFSNAQIAKVRGKSLHQTENLLYRAGLALKAELEKEGFAYEDQ